MTSHASPQPGLRGRYAGIASRFVAYVADLGASTGVFLLALAAASFAASVVTGDTISWNRSNTLVGIAFTGWQFVYYAYSWAANGKTFGMALLGIRVVRADGREAGTMRAVLRTLVFPLSFLFCGLGFAGILLGNDRKALHDVIAGTAVVYAWDARVAHFDFLSRNGPGG